MERQRQSSVSSRFSRDAGLLIDDEESGLADLRVCFSGHGDWHVGGAGDWHAAPEAASAEGAGAAAVSAESAGAAGGNLPTLLEREEEVSGRQEDLLDHNRGGEEDNKDSTSSSGSGEIANTTGEDTTTRQHQQDEDTTAVDSTTKQLADEQSQLDEFDRVLAEMQQVRDAAAGPPAGGADESAWQQRRERACDMMERLMAQFGGMEDGSDSDSSEG